MKKKFQELKIDIDSLEENLQTKLNDIFSRYTREDPGLQNHLYEILTVSIACGKTRQILEELEAHWENHLGRDWAYILGTDPTYFMLYNLGEKLGIVYF